MTLPPSFTLDQLRHSTAHILAQAVLRLYPDAKLGIGPTIQDGFYYDFDLSTQLSPDDLKAIEKEMKSIIKKNQKFCHFTRSHQDSISLMKEKNQPYKVELIQDLSAEDYSFYQNDEFIDLCKGPHIASTGQVKAFKLIKIAGAYWRGNEKNKMLQRIYGTAFETKEDLAAHLLRMEEAKKRDHRVLGKALDLFGIKEDVGGGLILWHPKGARIRNLLENYWREEHFSAGYELLYSPHIGKSDLWDTSGHLGFYQENMYAPVTIEEQDYYLKPMNCPFHIMVFKDRLWSYKELPLRWAELGTVYRYERSGVLFGLMRVRGFTQDDAHIICTPEQMASEIERVITFCIHILSAFNFGNYEIYLSTRPQEKYVGDIEAWDNAESALKAAIKKLELPFKIDEGGGAFYGPKIDIKIEDAIGRKWQCSTIQFDFNLPERFDMTFVGADGHKHRPYMIHRALFGSLERFFGILIEHYGGKFPTWLAPVQARILSISSEVGDYCEEVKKQLIENHVRCEWDSSSEKINYKVRVGTKEKIPYLVVIGNKEKEIQTLSIRDRATGQSSTMTIDDFIKKIKKEVEEKTE